MGHEAERLGGRRLGDLDRVERVRAAGVGHLEGERDVHRPESCSRRALTISAAAGEETRCSFSAEWAQQLGGVDEARLGHRADHARSLQVAMLARRQGVDALGREGDEHVLAGRSPRSAERLDEQLARAAHVRRSTSARASALRARARTTAAHGACQRFRVGAPVRVERVGHADQHQRRRVPIASSSSVKREVRRRSSCVAAGARTAPPTQPRSRPRGCRSAGSTERLDSDDPEASLAQRDRARQARVAEADHRDEPPAGLNLTRDSGGADSRRPRTRAVTGG